MRPLRRRVVKASLQLVVVAVEGVLRLDLISGSLSRYMFARAANLRVYYPQVVCAVFLCMKYVSLVRQWSLVCSTGTTVLHYTGSLHDK
jgi:hypothetical protein